MLRVWRGKTDLKIFKIFIVDYSDDIIINSQWDVKENLSILLVPTVPADGAPLFGAKASVERWLQSLAHVFTQNKRSRG